MPVNPLTGQGFDSYKKFKAENFYLFGGINSKASAYTNTLTEFRDLSNVNFLYPGALTKRPGSTMYVGSTVTGSILGGCEFARQNGSSLIVFKANTNLYTASPPSSVNAVVTGLMSGAITTFVTFVDRLFVANGNDFFKFDGTNNYLYSLPPGATASWGVTAVLGGSLTPGITGTFVFAYGYVNERGYVGPISNGMTIVINGISFNSVAIYGLTQPFTSNYGITALQFWRTLSGGVNLYGTTTLALGGTQALDIGWPIGNSLAIPHLWFTLIPRYQALFNNQYFMGGFSTYPSRAYWSEIGEPEAVQPTFYDEFKTNDGDRITGFKLYNNAMIISKLRSLFLLSGDNPDNFSVQQLSDDYGCLSNQAMVVYDNYVWMLDQKGIVEFNGVNVQFASMKTEPYFLNMNVPAAIDKAVAVHYKQYNEVWFHFPSNGATLNNTTVVYDYVAKAWTRYDGIQASCMFPAQGTNPVRTVFYGGYTGALFIVGPSYMGDNGSAITCMAFTRWNAALGQTTESMYRRFWGDIEPVLGITSAIEIRLFTNYNATTIQATGTIFQSVFQTRLDFGLSSRTIAAQMIQSSASLPFKINAYTFESRYQRST